jgi:hypothetical protein
VFILFDIQKQVCVNVNGGPAVLDELAAVRRAEVPKAVPKKVVNVKPKAKEVIEISPDTEEGLFENAKQEKKKEGASKKKAAPTLTAVLTARSKVTFWPFFILYLIRLNYFLWQFLLCGIVCFFLLIYW